MNNTNKPAGAPSILDDVPMPFSGKRPTGLGEDFDTVYSQWKTQRTPAVNTQLLKTVQPIIDTALTS